MDIAILEYKAVYACDKTARPKGAATELNNIGLDFDSMSPPCTVLTYFQ